MAIFETEDSEAINKSLDGLERYVKKAPKKIFKHWQKAFEFYLADTLINCLVEQLEEQPKQAVMLALEFKKRTDYELFGLVELVMWLRRDSSWRQKFNKLLKRQKHFNVLPFLTVGSDLWQSGDTEAAERIYDQGLEFVRQKEESAKPVKASPGDETLYSAYARLYDALIEMWQDEEETVKLKLVKQNRKRVEKQRQKLESKSAPRLESAALEKLETEFEQGMLEQDPAWQYYQYLKKFNINFATKELTQSVRTVYSQDGQKVKVGRNDPCPCGKTKADGAPVKYKKCCGR